jgi:hypothetical protein
MVSGGDLGFAARLGTGASPRNAWEEIRARCSGPELRAVLGAMRASDQGRAALEASRQQWLAQGLVPPWEPAITPVPLDEAVPDGFVAPEGTTASRCAACGETRLNYPADLTDEWKHHFDYCSYPEVRPDEPEPEAAEDHYPGPEADDQGGMPEYPWE